MLSTMTPVSPWANEIRAAQQYDAPQSSQAHTGDACAASFMPNVANLTLRTGKPAGNAVDGTSGAPLRHQVSLGDLQFEEMLFGSATRAMGSKAQSPATTPPISPRHSEEACTPEPNRNAEACGMYEGLPLSSEVICSPRVPSPRCDFSESEFFCDSLQHSEASTSGQSDASAAKMPEKVGPSSFELLRVVGQGAFGKVFQVRKKDSGHVYAMKVMRKEKILEKDHCDYVKAERDVLTSIVHPYIVTLRYSFQTSSKLYLVLDFINGGHLFFQLYRQGIFTEELARLYTAEIVLAIAHLHSLGFVHRDLKPENVLLDSDGHVKVTDFGLAKGNITDDIRTNSFIGTMEYMAPEIISGKGHGKSADWWSVGILLYEMLCGQPPFRAKGRNALQKQIMGSKIKIPPYVSSESAHLLKSLLQREVPKRLGYGAKGSDNVMKHAFFRSISWDKLMKHQIPSPFKPNVKHVDSVENFDKIWTDLNPVDSPCGTPRSGSDDARFAGFSYCDPSLAEELANARIQD